MRTGAGTWPLPRRNQVYAGAMLEVAADGWVDEYARLACMRYLLVKRWCGGCLSIIPSGWWFTWEEEEEACLGEGQGREGIRPWQAL